MLCCAEFCDIDMNYCIFRTCITKFTNELNFNYLTVHSFFCKIISEKKKQVVK